MHFNTDSNENVGFIAVCVFKGRVDRAERGLLTGRDTDCYKKKKKKCVTLHTIQYLNKKSLAGLGLHKYKLYL